MPAFHNKLSITTSNTEADATIIHYGPFHSARIINTSGASVTATIKESDSPAGTYVTAADCGAAGAITIPNNESLELPTKLAASSYIKLIKSAGSATLTILLKD